MENRFIKLQKILEKASNAGAAFAHDALKELSKLQNDSAQGGEHQRLAALFAFSRAMGSSLDLDKILRESIDAVIDLTGAEPLILSGDQILQIGRLHPEERRAVGVDFDLAGSGDDRIGTPDVAKIAA